MGNWLSVQKELIIDKINETINFIIDIPIKHNEQEKKEYENIIIILEEAKINCKNNKYFDIEDIYIKFPKLDPILQGFGIDDIDNITSIYNKNIVELFLDKNRHLFKNDENNENLREFSKRINCHKDLREEFINLILENYSLKDLDLITDNEEEIKKFIEKALS